MQSLRYNKLLLAIIGLGIFLRIREYLFNRSLRLEEASLALNIVNKSFGELFSPLDFEQRAPLVFLWLEKFSLILFGNSEYSLRLFPLLASLLSLPLFYKISRYFLQKQSAILSLFIFSTLDILIYYSSELKQYSFDVFAALLIYYFIIKFAPNLPSAKTIIALSFMGGIIWFSHPAIFVLAGVGATIFINFIFKKQINKALSLALCGCFWLVSFAFSYLAILRETANDKPLQDFWQWAFASNSLSDPAWFYHTFLAISSDILYLASPALALFILISCLWLIKYSKLHLFLLLTPLFLAIFASMMQLYPLLDRFTLFLIPNFIILFVLGVEKVFKRNFVLQLLVIILTFYPSLVLDLHHLQTPRIKEDTRSVIEFYSKTRQSGDIIYVYYGSESPFRYYAPNTDFVLGKASREQPAGYRTQIDQLRGHKRVWFLFSHVVNTKLGIVNEEQFFLSYLDNIGKRIDYFKALGASVYLYDLSN